MIYSNLLSVHADSAYSVPEAWQIQMAQQFNYTASLPIPLSNEVTLSAVLWFYRSWYEYAWTINN